MVKDLSKSPATNWANAWSKKLFRQKIIIGFAALVTAIVCMPAFFQYVEKRPGVQLNDWILRELPPVNLSIPIFLLIWASVIIAVVTAVRKPYFLLTLLYAYLLLCLSRYITIASVALEAPKGLVILADPLSNLAYGDTFITKDLFFSGHTSTLFLIYLCLQQKPAKYFTLLASILVGIFLLFQHVHYTVDIVLAPLFAYAVFTLAKKISRQPETENNSAD